MNTIILNEDDILEYVNDCINKIKIPCEEITNAEYHHNTSYKDAASICKYGILTLADLNKYGIRNDPEELLKIMDDNESHVNGNRSISLSVVGLTDLYSNEDEYDPFYPNNIDFLIDSNIFTHRSSINYGNEFLSDISISREKIKSIDIRLLKLLYLKNSLINTPIEIIQKYNYLINIAKEIKKQNLSIPLREMSESDTCRLNIEKLSNKPKILLKKR